MCFSTIKEKKKKLDSVFNKNKPVTKTRDFQ